MDYCTNQSGRLSFRYSYKYNLVIGNDGRREDSAKCHGQQLYLRHYVVKVDIDMPHKRSSCSS